MLARFSLNAAVTMSFSGVHGSASSAIFLGTSNGASFPFAADAISACTASAITFALSSASRLWLPSPCRSASFRNGLGFTTTSATQ